ncbi:MAG: DUF805 domain-containing protein [Lachnospiraceae bacterium]|nr:DUF805 domain-containing protein [Lachnospiraceae bacterium]
MRSYLSMWNKCFDYKGKADLKEFWIPVLVHAVLIALAGLYWILAKANGWSALPFWYLVGYLVLATVPFIALTVRRLHDTGRNGIWAWLLLFVGPGTIAVLALCAAASGFTPAYNRPVNLYGPPEWFDPSSNVPDEVYGPPEWFDPSSNENVDVYGPPPTDEPEETDPGETVTEPASFEPTENIPEPVYGPPEWFTEDETEESGEESTEEEKETRTIEPETLDPGTNINDPLYGVPTPTVSR